MKLPAIPSLLVGLAMAGCAAAVPAAGNKVDPASLPSTLSEAVRADLAQMDPSSYTLYTSDNATGLDKRAQVNGIINRCTTSRCLSMTFDDGPYDQHRTIVDQFESVGSKATFFVNGNNFRCIYNEPQVQALRYSYERGHQICMHSWSHPDISTLNNAQLDRQVQLVEDALWRIIGAVPSCFRAPFGSIRPDQVTYLNNRWGLQVVHWNYDTEDANGRGVDYALNVYRGLVAPKHAIVLAHETVASTVNTVNREALNIIRRNGYSGSQTVAATNRFNPYKVQGPYGRRDGNWQCNDKPAPGQL